jgi:hypothetical protein
MSKTRIEQFPWNRGTCAERLDEELRRNDAERFPKSTTEMFEKFLPYTSIHPSGTMLVGVNPERLKVVLVKDIG